MPNIYARMFPTDTPIQVYGPASPQPGGGMVYPSSPGIAVMGSATWGSSILGLSSQFVMGNGSFGTESDPLSLHLDQTTTQTIINGIPTFSNGINLSNLTSGRIPYAGTAGLLGDSSNLAYAEALSGTELLTNGAFTGNANGWTLGTGYHYGYTFTVSGVTTPSLGQTYTNNGKTFTVTAINLTGSDPTKSGTMTMTGTGAPQAGKGTLSSHFWSQSKPIRRPA